MSTVALRSGSRWSYPALSAGALAGALAVHGKVAASSQNQALRTTMIYTHVLNRGPAGVQSPADRMFLC